jgi:hypothetical protein
LVCHCDGFTQLGKSDRGCVNRKKAKQAGVKLPPSVAERQKMETNVNGETKQIGISGFLQLRKAFRCNSFGLCPKFWPKNFQFSSVNLCHKAIILLKIAQKMDKTL